MKQIEMERKIYNIFLGSIDYLCRCRGNSMYCNEGTFFFLFFCMVFQFVWCGLMRLGMTDEVGVLFKLCSQICFNFIGSCFFLVTGERNFDFSSQINRLSCVFS